ncbi:MAG: serine/threonine protein kinase [Myxococcales bacterium]|nr:serine/threonine protein kinase [Myxococcales bacterium]
MSTQESENSAVGSSARTLKERANDRLGEWVKGKWRIDYLLGVGGMASVYAATHRNGSRVALKILHTEFARETSVKQRFLREGYVANKVDHAGRVAILDDDETELGEPFLVMELLEGETLQQLWKRLNRKVPAPDALRIAGDVLDTLIGFHDLGIIHRDLKPPNIFVTQEGVVKLLDFGVARFREGEEDALTRAGTALGTPSYMSPEQAMGKSEIDARSDIYAVGATLYAILSGQRLHHGKSDNEAFILAATQPVPSIARSAPELPIEVIAIVDKALQWDRRNRFQGAAEMRDECRRVIGVLAQPRIATPVSLASAGAAISGRSGIAPGTSGQEQWLRPSFEPHSNRLTPSGTPIDARAGFAPHSSPSQSGSAGSPSEAARRTRAAAQGGPAHASDRGLIKPQEEGPQALAREVFARLERALPIFRQFTIDHPESTGRIRALFRTVTDALRHDPNCLVFTVHPFCFTQGHGAEEVPVWEPGAPHDSVPYVLCAAGVEEVRISRGVTEQELGALVRAMTMDPSTGDDDSDVLAALWEARFTNVRCRVRDDLAARDAAEQERFFSEAEGLEQLAREDLAEVAAMAVATDTSGFLAAESAAKALELDPAARAALGAQLSLDAGHWRERFFDAAAEAYIDGELRGDSQLFLAPLARHARTLITRSRYQELFATYSLVIDAITRRAQEQPRPVSVVALTNGLFPQEIVRQLVRLVQSGDLPPTERAPLLDGLRAVLERLDGSWLDDVLTDANQLPDGDVFELLMAYVRRHAAANAGLVVARLDALRPVLAQQCLALIAADRTPEAVGFLQPLLSSRNAALRAEAMALLATNDEQLGKQLLELAESTDAATRFAALTTMRHHHVRSAGPGLVRFVEGFEGFRRRPVTEQREIFETLFALHPSRAEAVVMSVLDHHGIMADSALDSARALAAEVLGKHAATERALDALENAARRRPWNTPELRKASGAGAEAVSARLGRTYDNGGERDA